MLQSLGGIVFSLVVAALVAWAGSSHSVAVDGVSLFALCAVLVFVVQWIAFLPAWILRTEVFYDLTGSVTYAGIVLVALWLVPDPGARSWLIALLVIVWAARLGTFLFLRAISSGDSRFDQIKQNFLRFLMTWTLQGLWVIITVSAGLAAMVSTNPQPLGVWSVVGLLVFLAGFAIEAVADWQKKKFRQDPANEGKFIARGLWGWSRHPNYFGEIMLWVGIAIIAAPQLQGWQYVTLISPVFVFVLIRFVSGVPMLERKADRRWGGEIAYQRYKRRTPALVPVSPRWQTDSKTTVQDRSAADD